MPTASGFCFLCVVKWKGVMSERGITAGFKSAKKQGCKIVVIDMDEHVHFVFSIDARSRPGMTETSAPDMAIKVLWHTENRMDLHLCIFLYDFAFNYMFLLIQTVQKPCNPTDATYLTHDASQAPQRTHQSC